MSPTTSSVCLWTTTPRAETEAARGTIRLGLDIVEASLMASRVEWWPERAKRVEGRLRPMTVVSWRQTMASSSGDVRLHPSLC